MIILFDDHQYRHYNRHARDPEEEQDLTPHVLRWNLELFKKKIVIMNYFAHLCSTKSHVNSVT